MRPAELGRTLYKMYRDAPEGEKTTMIHLFGIKYADKIRDREEPVPVREIIRLSGLPETYDTEVSKGVRLARYVVLRDG